MALRVIVDTYTYLTDDAMINRVIPQWQIGVFECQSLDVMFVYNMKSSFPKRVNLKFNVAMSMPSSEIVYWKRTHHSYTYVKCSFPNHNLST